MAVADGGMADWPTALAILALVVVAAAIQAHSGFGFALFLVPLASALIAPRETVLLAGLLALAMNGMQGIHLRRFVDRRLASLLTAGSLLGMPAGMALLLLADPLALRAGAAVAVLLFTALIATGVRIPAGGVPSDLAAGMVSGMLNTSTGISGPPVAIYLQNRLLLPTEFRGTIAAFFFVTSIGAVALFVAAGAIEPWLLMVAVMSLPSLFLGSRLGNALFARTSEVNFRRSVLSVLGLSGTAALLFAVRDAYLLWS
jgi:uncharacterized membrane protein YfcA